MIYDVGQVCVKIAGRDAGKKCVVVEKIDNTYVLIDGQTRRRKCNIAHIEPTKQSLKIKAGADSAAVSKAFEDLGVSIAKGQSKQSTSRPKKAHKQNKPSTATKK